MFVFDSTEGICTLRMWNSAVQLQCGELSTGDNKTAQATVGVAAPFPAEMWGGPSQHEGGEGSNLMSPWNEAMWASVRQTSTSENHVVQRLCLKQVCSTEREMFQYLMVGRTITAAGEVKHSKISIFPSWKAFRILMGMSENHLHLG